MAILLIMFRIGFALFQLAGCRPVPPGLGGYSAFGKFRYVAGLTGNPVGVIIEFDALERHGVRAIGVAGIAGENLGIAKPRTSWRIILHGAKVSRPGPEMGLADMAVDTLHVAAFRGHVNIDMRAGV